MYQLEDLIPTPINFTLSGTNPEGEKVNIDLTFKPFVVADESYLRREYGEKGLQRIFETLDMDEISKIGFKQLTLGSKRKLMDIKFIEMDEHGREIEIAKTGSDKIKMLLSSIQEQVDFIKSLIETRGASFPILQEIGRELEKEVKKKIG